MQPLRLHTTNGNLFSCNSIVLRVGCWISHDNSIMCVVVKLASSSRWYAIFFSVEVFQSLMNCSFYIRIGTTSQRHILPLRVRRLLNI